MFNVVIAYKRSNSLNEQTPVLSMEVSQIEPTSAPIRSMNTLLKFDIFSFSQVLPQHPILMPTLNT